MIPYIERYYKVPAIEINETAEKAISVLAEYKVEDLHIVEKSKYIGTLSSEMIDESHLKDSLNMMRENLNKISIHPLDSMYDIWLKFITNHTTQIAVTNDDIFLGGICFNDFIREYEKDYKMIDDGSWIFCSVSKVNFSMSLISSIIEENHSIIQHFFILHTENEEDLIVTLRINSNEIASIENALGRHNIEVIKIHTKKDDQEPLRERYEELMHYLNV